MACAAADCTVGRSDVFNRKVLVARLHVSAAMATPITNPFQRRPGHAGRFKTGGIRLDLPVILIIATPGVIQNHARCQ